MRPRGVHSRAVRDCLRGIPAPVAESNCLYREVGWGATRGELPVRRETNGIRFDNVASLRPKGEAQKTS